METSKTRYTVAALLGIGILGAAYWIKYGYTREYNQSAHNSSIEIFVKYLKEAKQAAREGSKPLRICLGNTSGDVDSIIGALGMAYYLTLK